MTSVDLLVRSSPAPHAERFWSKVATAGPNECWLWTASLGRKGYGKFKLNGKMTPAHRVAYELLVDPIPEDLVLDHVRERGCISKSCVNPAHLEPVTNLENIRRGRRRSATHCDKGHPFNDENTYIRKGDREGLFKRRCRPCKREWTREYRARKRAAKS